jgi:hypothetical protein
MVVRVLKEDAVEIAGQTISYGEPELAGFNRRKSRTKVTDEIGTWIGRFRMAPSDRHPLDPIAVSL